jgi:hypothetical protein
MGWIVSFLGVIARKTSRFGGIRAPLWGGRHRGAKSLGGPRRKTGGPPPRPRRGESEARLADLGLDPRGGARACGSKKNRPETWFHTALQPGRRMNFQSDG